METDKWFQNHIAVVGTTENEVPWTLVTSGQVSAGLCSSLHPPGSQPKTDMKL